MKLVHASISEHNNAGWDGNAQAGDQTGKEVCVVGWYSVPWNLMLRFPNKTTAARASAAAVKLAQSGLVGYDQTQRNTLYAALKRYNFDVDAYIRSGIKTEADCSSFVYAVFACYLVGIRSDENAPTTSTMQYWFKRWGFDVYTSARYLNGSDVRNGDIMVRESYHTAIVTDGDAAAGRYSEEVQNAIDVLARDVIAGHWGNGTERRDAIYKAVQNRVNEMCRASMV